MGIFPGGSWGKTENVAVKKRPDYHMVLELGGSKKKFFSKKFDQIDW